MSLSYEGHVERFHPRVTTNFMVKLKLEGRTVLTRARDLSMAGLCLLGDFAESMERVTIGIPLPDDREIVTEAVVKRRTPATLALEFDGLDWDDFLALARYLHPRLP